MAVSANNDSCAPLVMGGYDCEFVDPPPDSLQCPVCLLPFRDPTILSCCGLNACASCIGRIKAGGHPCPICQQPFETMIEKKLQRKVLDFRVFCSKKEEGCPWKGELRDLETHLGRDCGHVEEECRYGCGGRYQRRFVRDHEMDECPKRPPEIVTQSLMRKMAERMDKLEKARCNDQAKLNQHIEQLRQENEKLTRKVADLENRLVQETDQGRDLAKSVDELKNELEHQTTTLHSQIVAAQIPVWLMDTKGILSCPYPPTHIIMPRFSQYRRDGDEWFSQPFYSQPGGYKLCLSVAANGYGSGKGTHVSVYVYLMKGENDHQLQWPFEQVVTYGILNWKRDENHVINTSSFKYALTGAKQRVTSEERIGNGMGYGQFLLHSSLSDGAAKDTQYLHNDCLCLQVLKVEPPK